jgi:hypothetical protein
MGDGHVLFKVLSLDDGDGLFFFEFSASNGLFSATQDFWDYRDTFEEFGRMLSEFPTVDKNVVTFEIGSMEETAAYYLRVSAYTFDAVGHAAIEVVVDNHRKGEQLAKANFQIPCEIAAINRLGKALRRWSADPTVPMIWKPIQKEM